MKTKYFIEQAQEIHRDKYNYSLVNYTNIHTKVKIICPLHGEFEQSPHHHIRGRGCKKCKNLHSKSINFYINKFKEVHKEKYDYKFSIYINFRTKITILCFKHGLFTQLIPNHLKGQGCPQCKHELMSVIKSENSGGFSYYKWYEEALCSKNFDSFKVYIIKCWNDNEEFYKIGKTFLTLENRFKYFPYNYELLHIIKDNDYERISKIEQNLLNINSENKYNPLLYFQGISECFKIIKLLK